MILKRYINRCNNELIRIVLCFSYNEIQQKIKQQVVVNGSFPPQKTITIIYLHVSDNTTSHVIISRTN